MTLFLVLAVLLMAILLIPVLLTLLRARPADATQREELNVALFQERRDELEQELNEGSISEDQYEAARVELERDLLLNTGEEPELESRPARGLAITLGIAVPLLAVFLYLQLGAPDFINPPQLAVQHQSDRNMDMSELTARLAQRLEEDPEDVSGWLLLGRSMQMHQHFDEAASVYERALEKAGEHPELLVDYAEMLAGRQGSMQGRPAELVARALELDAASQGALWLAGAAAFEKSDYPLAVEYWQKLQKSLGSEEDQLAGLLQDNIHEAHQRMGGAIAVEDDVAQQLEPVTGADPVAGSLHLPLRVTLEPDLLGQVQAGQTLFIMARPPAGGMPYAAVRRQAGELPLEMVLDEASLLNRERSLEGVEELEIMARISRSGDAAAVSGDLYGRVLAAPIATGQIEILIDRVQP